MSDNRDIGYATFFLGSGIWYFFWGFKRLRRKRKIENIPTSTVRGLAIGLVELIGKAKKMSSIRSPLTATECLLYRYTLRLPKKTEKTQRLNLIYPHKSSRNLRCGLLFLA